MKRNGYFLLSLGTLAAMGLAMVSLISTSSGQTASLRPGRNAGAPVGSYTLPDKKTFEERIETMARGGQISSAAGSSPPFSRPDWPGGVIVSPGHFFLNSATWQ